MTDKTTPTSKPGHAESGRRKGGGRDGTPAPPEKLFFKASDLAALLGVAISAVRYWDSQFPQISPLRLENGTYLYRPEDLAVFLEVKRLLHDEGFTVAGARKKLDRDWASSRGLAPREKPGRTSAASSLADRGEPAGGSPVRGKKKSAPPKAASEDLVDELKKELRAIKELLAGPVDKP
ncbi:MAG: MerR family transcriptional regulator [Deltaproteobacteria bacterium]|jgi:DNA-binding transcriptional MerR regulator|nr:MerR family transcriptional regulator [Deltaproteobacteria bacterium]